MAPVEFTAKVGGSVVPMKIGETLHSLSIADDKQPQNFRRGKWTTEEEAFAARLIRDFDAGLLPLENGATLRAFLSKKLNCSAMRISKKFAGEKCLGKQIFTRRPGVDDDQLEQETQNLARLEAAFWKSISSSSTTTTVPRTSLVPSLPTDSDGASSASVPPAETSSDDDDDHQQRPSLKNKRKSPAASPKRPSTRSSSSPTTTIVTTAASPPAMAQTTTTTKSRFFKHHHPGDDKYVTQTSSSASSSCSATTADDLDQGDQPELKDQMKDDDDDSDSSDASSVESSARGSTPSPLEDEPQTRVVPQRTTSALASSWAIPTTGFRELGADEGRDPAGDDLVGELVDAARRADAHRSRSFADLPKAECIQQPPAALMLELGPTPRARLPHPTIGAYAFSIARGTSESSLQRMGCSRVSLGGGRLLDDEEEDVDLTTHGCLSLSEPDDGEGIPNFFDDDDDDVLDDEATDDASAPALAFKPPSFGFFGVFHRSNTEVTLAS